MSLVGPTTLVVNVPTVFGTPPIGCDVWNREDGAIQVLPVSESVSSRAFVINPAHSYAVCSELVVHRFTTRCSPRDQTLSAQFSGLERAAPFEKEDMRDRTDPN
jgi:hypothetical protein